MTKVGEVAMQREQAPSWVGPLTALIVVLVVAFIAVVLWLTVFASGGEEESHDEGAAFQVRHEVVLRT
jgi:hypothetical protein